MKIFTVSERWLKKNSRQHLCALDDYEELHVIEVVLENPIIQLKGVCSAGIVQQALR